MEYLKNKLFKFTPLFKIDFSKKKNLICASLFKLDNQYKPFNIYLTKIENIYTKICETHKDYTFRIFIDRSIYEDKNIMFKLNKLKKIELVLYDFLFDINKGLVGTLVRFFPMFDFEFNDANIVLNTDTDHFMVPNFNSFFYTLKKNKIDINKIYLIKNGNLLQNMQYENFESIIDNHLNIYIYANHLVNIKKINKNVIENFILNIIETKNELSFFKKFKYSNNVFKSKFINTKPFIYGVDEYFINYTLNNYLKDNKLFHVDIIKFNIKDIYYYLIKERDFYKNLSIQEKKILLELLQIIIKNEKLDNEKLGNKKKNNNNLLKYFNKLNSFYDKKNIPSIKIKTIYILFILMNNENFDFIYNPELKKFMLKNYFGIYAFEKFYLYNINNIVNKNKEITISQENFDSKFINELKKIKN